MHSGHDLEKMVMGSSGFFMNIVGIQNQEMEIS